MNQEEQDKKMNQLVARCWSDEGFKQKLLADPAAMLKAECIELPVGKAMEALAALVNADKVLHPDNASELSDEDLDKVAGAAVETKWNVLQ